jgi:hypothetical protein
MKLSLQHILLLAAAIAVALLADAWRSARHDSQQLAATLAVQNAAIQQAGDLEKQRDSQLAAALAAIQAQKRSVRTPQQAAKQLLDVLPSLPLPVSIHDADLSVPLPPGEVPAASISIPQPDLVPLYDNLQDCRASAIQNDTLQKDLSDEKTRATALLNERDVAIAAAHGGSFLLRVKRAAKWFAIGAATGAVVAAVAHH